MSVNDVYPTCRVCNDAHEELSLGICPDCRKKHTIIVSRHRGLIEWLHTQGITGKIINHVANPEQIRGKIVYGALPLGLAAETLITYSVNMRRLSKELRGQDLSMDEMIAAGAELKAFKVQQLNENEEW